MPTALPTQLKSRTEVREHFPTEVRLLLAEDDLDRQEDRFASIDNKLNRLLWFAGGSFVSFGCSAVLLAWNLFGR